MNETIEKLKPFLLNYVEEITTKSINGGKNQYICPLCSSGTGSHHSGAFTVYPDTDSYHCFACDANGDIFNLYGEINHISDFKTIADDLANKYNIFSSQPIRTKKQPTKLVQDKKEKDYTNFFSVAEQHLNETDYLTKRGISPKIQQKFHCGYVPNFMYKGNQTTSAVIIPTSKGSYMWRSTTENIKQKRGTAHILNPSALNSPYCFVVEGEIDCMSVDECGFTCIGLGSTSNIRKIFDYDTSKTLIIIALDNDKTGNRATTALANECDERNVPYIIASKDIWSDCKDANELLVKDKAQLIASLQEHSDRATALDKDQWLREMLEHKQNSSDSGLSNNKKNATNKKKIPLERFEQFEEFIDKCGYSIKYNQITHNFEFYGFDKGESAEHLAENVPSILKDKLKEDFNSVSRQDTIDYITRYATRHKFNPVLNAIKSVKWDGKDRIEEIYTIFRIPSASTEEGKYSRIYIRKWLMQTCCALFNVIECPFSLDIILVFKGRQGIGKTRFFEKLALKSQFFGEGICLDPRDKDSVMQATSKWISELGEIGSTMRKDMDSVKAFLTKSTDEYRTPYGKASLHYPRMTSFVGTVNDDEFLIDQTGNRRFATIPLPADLIIDYETQIKPFDALQLWAQVYEFIKDKDKSSCFRLTEDEKRQLEKRNSAFVKPMKAECEVLDILEEQQTQEQGHICTFKEMTVTEFIKIHNLKYDARTVGQVLKKYGYESKVKRDGAKTTRVIKLPFKHWNGNHSH
ncbi:MAG: toprim domain-containing protein [Ruminococcus sp.]|nr:toprim domain-containing protein [Ruminococcus sp.]MDE6848356.1 toprim domain-containing protein [Ruminococcus sp.]